ncbi:hypothetical protein Lbys_0712 [Leadbetterella byssophila DSM 17132]|uniref:Integral membrane bound transporter domain-containing protein n=2 Tax=Leadbetterella TaxID=319458 RepID=E4RZD5_LEAB4|nr:FUSC family protein [Leadbetterella byssophila]ADQ16474.1 hypothetical protein Lbys_0712 [Leadbetterella byssophila DSM 17132]
MTSLFKLNPTQRKWHLPLVAGVSVGLPLLLCYFTGEQEGGRLGALAGLSILYLQSNKLVERMMILMTCCFGILLSYCVGIWASANPLVAPLALGLHAFAVHLALHHLRLTRPPGNFFFIMIASMAIYTPFDLAHIPEKIGYVAMGTISTCIIGFIYSLLTIHQEPSTPLPEKEKHINITESIIFGIFMAISMTVAQLSQFENPYWILISCIAVMQGSNTKHVWLRGTQRIIGTLIGLGIVALISLLNPSYLFMIICIIVMQVIVEYFVVRNYAIAVVFITVLTIFLSEAGGDFEIQKILIARMVDILIGSIIGIVGGWALYHEKVHYYSTKRWKK